MTTFCGRCGMPATGGGCVSPDCDLDEVTAERNRLRAELEQARMGLTFELEQTRRERDAAIALRDEAEARADICHANHAGAITKLRDERDAMRAERDEALRRQSESERSEGRCAKAYASAIDRAEAAEARFLSVLRTDQPWPLVDIVRELVWGAEHLLQDHCCDVHGHEGIEEAKTRAEAWLAELTAKYGSGS